MARPWPMRAHLNVLLGSIPSAIAFSDKADAVLRTIHCIPTRYRFILERTIGTSVRRSRANSARHRQPFGHTPAAIVSHWASHVKCATVRVVATKGESQTSRARPTPARPIALSRPWRGAKSALHRTLAGHSSTPPLATISHERLMQPLPRAKPATRIRMTGVRDATAVHSAPAIHQQRCGERCCTACQTGLTGMRLDTRTRRVWA